MTRLEVLVKQTTTTYEWTNKILESIPIEKWNEMPPTLNTNVTWQTGHLLVSICYHSIIVISGRPEDIPAHIPLQHYSALFTNRVAEDYLEIRPNALFNQMKLIQQQSLHIISKLTEDTLDQQLEETRIKHPIATNKFQAIDWNLKHTMWHCGQLGLLKRVIDTRYDFGLRL